MKTKNNKIAERNIARRESEIMNILNHTAKFVLYDPTLKTASFTYVDLTKDKSTVFVYVDTYKRNEIDHLVEQLNKSKGVFRSELSKNMKLWKVPQLVFKKDESIDRSIKIDNLIRDINKK